MAFVDILGFARLVSEPTSAFSAKFRSYSQSIRDATCCERLRYVVFSDTIVVTTTDDTEDSFKAIVAGCSRLFDNLVVIGFPFRGCISWGPYERFAGGGESGVIIAGPPIIDAYRYAERQDWVGIIISPSVLRHIRRPSESAKPLLLLYREIPLKGETGGGVQPYEGYAVAPYSRADFSLEDMDFQEVRTRINECQQRLVPLLQTAPGPPEQDKIRNTRSFLNHCERHIPNR